LDLLKILKVYFEKEGYTVFLAEDGEQALDIFYREKLDLAVIDWMMPQVSGLSVCKEIKQKGDTKVLMLTAKSEVEDELYALNIGADDYVKKPFHPGILLTRAKKLLKDDQSLLFDELKIDLQAKKVFKNDVDLNFTIKTANADMVTCSWTPNDAKKKAKEYSLQRKKFEYKADVGSYPQASMRLLKPKDVENEMKEDLEFMRNEIFARHGYCFNRKHLRQQFENEDWYVPNTVNIKGFLTDIEKKNIAMIKRYEKYAEEYGDEYGR